MSTQNHSGAARAKKVKIIATIILSSGLLVALVANGADGSDTTVALGMLAFLGGLIAFVVGRFME